MYLQLLPTDSKFLNFNRWLGKNHCSFEITDCHIENHILGQEGKIICNQPTPT